MTNSLSSLLTISPLLTNSLSTLLTTSPLSHMVAAGTGLGGFGLVWVVSELVLGLVSEIFGLASWLNLLLRLSISYCTLILISSWTWAVILFSSFPSSFCTLVLILLAWFSALVLIPACRAIMSCSIFCTLMLIFFS